jgi:transcriptional regulator with PAS, ATPase and Fis domain
VLITGESGSGKEVVANCIQCASSRKDMPYVKINCAAISANLLEAELFGYEKGAFTGSVKSYAGLFAAADRGTILLDEIGDFPMELQPKLLRVLQEGEFYRIGSNTPKHIDVRVIAATNSNLEEKMRNGSFREDLFYRLNVFPIRVPPLRERPEDVRLFVDIFLKIYSEKHGKALHIAPTIYDMFKNYIWPGNVRELQNVLEYFVICSDEKSVMSIQDLSRILGTDSPEQLINFGANLFEMRDNYEKHLIEQALQQSDNDRQAAKLLGVYHSTFYRKLVKYNLHNSKTPVKGDGRP